MSSPNVTKFRLLAFASLVGLLAIAAPVARTQTLTVLHSFTGTATDGNQPTGGLALDAQGNLYGTTFYGGAYGSGTVFKLTPSGNISLLHSFAGGSDGNNPMDTPTLDASDNVYGTTSGDPGAEGATNGTVFKVTPGGEETVVLDFPGGAGGYSPVGGVVRDSQGNLYGTTLFGGSSACNDGCGTVFKVTPAGEESVLYSFAGPPDGEYPRGGLIMDGSGNLYGTTEQGGSGGGVVFKLSPTGTETLLHTFGGTGDGSAPFAGLTMDASGNLYGTTDGGGAGGWGTVFEVTAAGEETVLHSFLGGLNGNTDGGLPYGGVVLDAGGNLYGTTSSGGTQDAGTIYEVNPPVAGGCRDRVCTGPRPAKETVLYSFIGGADGNGPEGGLVFDSQGNLYGTTVAGGYENCFSECGIVFKFVP